MQNIIIAFIRFLKNTILNILPSFDLNNSVANSVSSSIRGVLDLLRVVNYIIPVNTILTILGVVVAIYMFKNVLFICNWIIKRYRGG